jgi:hypothetical protein
MSAQILTRSFFGLFSRYCLQSMLTRFGTIEYFVLDANQTDKQGYAKVIMQTSDYKKVYNFISKLF